MAAVYGKVDKFDAKSQSWEDYIEVMGHYFVANGIEDQPQRKAILLASVGEKTYALIKSICQPSPPAEKSFNELVKLVQDHHTPKPSEIVQRYKFHTRSRKDGETIHEFVAELRSLSHVIDSTGVHPVQEKVQALQEARAPTNVSELKSYLGLLNYYNRFLPNLSTALAPLHRLLRKGEPWQWKDQEQASFDKSKQLILSADVLVHYCTERELILQCDASPYGVGAVLSHRMPDGTDKPISFASRTLNPAERNYAQLDKEGLSVMFGIKKFHKYLYGRPFTIYTDHKPLVSLFNEKKQVPTTASPRIQRWSVTLRGYEYSIKFRAGSENGNADAFSRLPLPVTEEMQPTDRVLMVQELDSFPLTAEQLRAWTAKDPVLANVKEYLLRGWPDDTVTVDPKLATYKAKKLELSVQDGCVLWGARVVIPPQGRKLVLEELHRAHPGNNRMKSLARSYVWWPLMDKDIEAVVKQCVNCQVHGKSPAVAPLHPWEWPGEPWKRLHMDYAGPFMGKMLFIVVDAHSKWVEAEIMNSTTSSATISKLRSMFATHGLPEVLVSDNASNFVSSEMEEFLSQNGVVHITSAPYHPSTNGLAERTVQTIKEGLKKMSGETMETKLQRVLFNYRITPHSTTEKSPAEMLMGRKLRCRLDLLHPNLQGKIHVKQMKMKQLHDQHVKLREFSTGDPVYMKNFGPGPHWIPAVVQEVTGPLSYTVLLGDGRIQRRHVDHLRAKWETQADLPVLLQPEEPRAVFVAPYPNDDVPVFKEQGVSMEEQAPMQDDAPPKEWIGESPEKIEVPHTPQQLERCSKRERKPPAYLKDFVT
ncbi:hypothetical protein QZH41_016473 [Actinostola sp. cb2023]|nr:hypothetical protein QZH41_016473 [Actinostola sp. cb2023]